MRQKSKRLDATQFELKQRLIELDFTSFQLLLIKRELHHLLRALPHDDSDFRALVLERVAESYDSYFTLGSETNESIASHSAYQRDILDTLDLIEHEENPFRIYN